MARETGRTRRTRQARTGGSVGIGHLRPEGVAVFPETPFSLRVVVAAGILALLAGPATWLWSQDAPPRPDGAAADKPEDESESQRQIFLGGSRLNSDPDLERVLRQADQLVDAGQHHLAFPLWQRVLSESGTLVLSQPVSQQSTYGGSTHANYSTPADWIEHRIGKLPSAAFRQYRRFVDAEATRALADAEKSDTGRAPGSVGGSVGRMRSVSREEKLNLVVRRYFHSSVGDEAALRLAGLLYDRGDPGAAARLCGKIVRESRGSRVSRTAVETRLALAELRLGRDEAALRLLRTADSGSGGGAGSVLPPPVLTALRNAVGEGEGIVPASASAPALERFVPDWPMPFGRASRTGIQSALSAASRTTTWSDEWSLDFSAVRTSSGPWDEAAARGRSVAAFVRPVSPEEDEARRELESSWRTNGWRPVSQILTDGSRLFFSTTDRMVSLDATDGRILWLGRAHKYVLDPLSRVHAGKRRPGSELKRPVEADHVPRFGDAVHGAATLAFGQVFVVEGDLVDADAEPQMELATRVGRRPAGEAPRRARHNWLAAYDSVSGRLRWHRGAFESPDDFSAEQGFLAAPVPSGDHLLVPASDRGDVWLLALDPRTGETAWKVFLCEDPLLGAVPWSPVAVAVDGRDCYVVPGTGQVIALEARTGAVRWVSRYQRSRRSAPQSGRAAMQTLLEFDGWDEDVVLAVGGRVVVLPSDAQRLFALERDSGRLAWEAPPQPAESDAAATHCIGLWGQGLIVAGPQVVRSYDVRGGRLVWEQSVGPCTGRGAATGDALLLPTGNGITALDPRTGTVLSHGPVVSWRQEPLGNLLSDGRRLLVAGPTRVYALCGLEQRLDRLATRVARDDEFALLDRMRLHARLGRTDEAIDDLRNAFRLGRERYTSETAARLVHAAVGDLSLATTDPRLALELLRLAHEQHAPGTPLAAGADLPPLDEADQQRRADLVRAALVAIRSASVADAADVVLAAAPLYVEDYLLHDAREALVATVATRNSDLLKQACTRPEWRTRCTATAALAKACGQEAGDLLVVLAADEREEVRSAAAVALADSGDRRALQFLVAQLSSDDPAVRDRAATTLRAFTGQPIAFAAFAEPEPRSAASADWQRWVDEHGATAGLRFPFVQRPPLVGRTLVGINNSKVVEYDAAGRTVWEVQIVGAFGCEGLPDGHRLVASHVKRSIVEYDSAGRETWSVTDLPGMPYSVRQIADGRLLVACPDSGEILEIARDKSIARRIQTSGRPMDAKRLDDGRTLVCLQGDQLVVEFDADGKRVRELKDMKMPVSAQRLENGHTLVCQLQERRVVELDQDQRVVWEKKDLVTPYDAQRLPNGNTLVADRSGVQEVDAKGRTVWRKQGFAATAVSRY